MRYDASLLTVFQGVIYARGSHSITLMPPTQLQDIFATLVCKSLVVRCVASIIDRNNEEFSDSCSTNYCYLRSAFGVPGTRGRKYKQQYKNVSLRGGLQTNAVLSTRAFRKCICVMPRALLSHFGSALLFRTTR